MSAHKGCKISAFQVADDWREEDMGMCTERCSLRDGYGNRGTKHCMADSERRLGNNGGAFWCDALVQHDLHTNILGRIA
jgi:hypothetical protein